MEWTQAIWIQQQKILAGSTGLDWSFVGLILNDPNDDARDPALAKLPSQLYGHMMQEIDEN